MNFIARVARSIDRFLDRIIFSRIAAVYGILTVLVSVFAMDRLNMQYGLLPVMVFLCVGVMGATLTVMALADDTYIWVRDARLWAHGWWNAKRIERSRMGHVFYMAFMYMQDIEYGDNSYAEVCDEVRRCYSVEDAELLLEQVRTYLWAQADGSRVEMVRVRA